MASKPSWLAAVLTCFAVFEPLLAAEPNQAQSLTMIVMDPLSKPLSCDCVKGYAQRNYELLGKYLTDKLGRPVKVVWNASLVKGIEDSRGAADLVIGKYSVVMHDAKSLKKQMRPVARLSGSKGDLNQHGLIVVRASDKSASVADLKGYRIFFGPEESEEKSAAAMRLLRSHGVTPPTKLEIYDACSEAAVALMKLPADATAAAVISSYAEPLLEGCGSIKKGDLRILGKTEEIPFVTAFVPGDMPAELRHAITEALLLSGTEQPLLEGLETLDGFVSWENELSAKKK